MKIAAYCRVSTDREEQLESLSNQEEFFRQFALKNGHDLIRIYSDEGISGKQMRKRPQFLQMLTDAKNNEFDMVVVKDVSRFARNTVDFLISIRDLKAIGIDVQFISTNQTVLGNSEFMLTIFSAMAQEESANLSTRVKFGKKQSAKRGKVPNFIYGYNWVDCYHLSINSEQAEIVRRIYKEYVDIGLGLRKIGIGLDADKILTPFGKDHWGTKTIKRILSNPIYTGTLVTRKSESIDFLSGKRRTLIPEEDFVFKKEEYRIISDIYFQKAKEILAQRAKQYKNANPCNRISSKYIFSTLIKCAECGASFTRRLSNNAKKPKYAYWKCSGNNTRGSHYCCNNAIVKEEEIQGFLRDYFLSAIENPTKIEEIINKTITAEKRFDKEDIKRKIDKLIEKKEKYFTMYINEIITIERLKGESANINDEIRHLQEKKCENPTGSCNKIVLKEYVDSYLKNGTSCNAELKKIIKNITVNQKREIIINFRTDLE